MITKLSFCYIYFWHYYLVSIFPFMFIICGSKLSFTKFKNLLRGENSNLQFYFFYSWVFCLKSNLRVVFRSVFILNFCMVVLFILVHGIFIFFYSDFKVLAIIDFISLFSKQCVNLFKIKLSQYISFKFCLISS